jgi:hypothetical protein
MKELRSSAGSSGEAMVKAFNASDQGAAWYEKRDNDFKADPVKNCAEAEKYYGPKGMGLLIKK